MRESFPDYAQSVLKGMSEEEWKHLWKRLELFAYKNYGWLEKRISGLIIEDVILEAIEDTYFGTRRWPVTDKQGNEVSLPVFICQAIRSKISHILEQEKKKVSINATSENSESESPDHSLKEPSVSLDHDTMIRYARLCKELMEIVRANPRLTEICALLIETPDMKPGEIAKILGLDEKEVRNDLRRLRRLARILRKER